jgi:type I restriction enzyme S subunit
MRKSAILFSEVPDDWPIAPIKSLAEYSVSNVDKHSLDNEEPIRLCNYTDVYKNERITLDMPLMQATATLEEISKFHLQIGDVVITKDSESWDDIAIPAYIAETSSDLVCGYHLAMIRPRSNVLNGRFLFRCLQSRPVALQLELASTGVTRYGLPKGAIGCALIPSPPVDIQEKIADFLDRETAEIDALVAEKERMLALLEEKRKALISHIVTRGLDPNAPFKTSGLDWLGDIPQHWKVRRLKFLIETLEQGSSPLASNVPAQPDELGILKLSAISKGRFIRHENKALQQADNSIQSLSLQKGDVLLTRGNTPKLVGDACVVLQDEPNLLISDLIYRIRVKETEILPKFLGQFLITPYARLQIEADARGSSGSMVKISQGHILDWLTPVPPKSEQQEIVEAIEQEHKKTQELESVLIESINLLKERRSALITAAVTGQIASEEMTA